MTEPVATDSVDTPSSEPSVFPCGQCGADLAFAPGTSSLRCGFCGHLNEIERGLEPIEEIDFRQTVAALGAAAPHVDVTSCHCTTCGVTLDRPPDLASFSCPYCGSNIVVTAQTTRLITPQAVLPFRVERRAAEAAFHKWISGLWFAPGKLKRYARTERRLDGVYVPYWTFDSDTSTDYTGLRGDYYYVTRTVRVNGKTQTRRERRIRWSSARGHVKDRFDDVLVLASTSLPKAYADELEPWPLDGLAPYRDDYLAGFRAERYHVELDAGFVEGRAIMEQGIRRTVCRDIGGDVQRINELRIHHDTITFKHILLPMWISTYRYRDRVFRILVNACTGEVQGERPWSAWKIAGAVLAGLAVAGIIALIAASR
ncbi:MAG: hypothetical protein KDA25_11250 [Phycisphaerales bacterium]|nr:hypothetical protein [Phycisphaerales bacterium]